jgi:hypothetical protein
MKSVAWPGSSIQNWVIMFSSARFIQTLTLGSLLPFEALISEEFVERLFRLVEGTRDSRDESFNYSLIRLIVSGVNESLSRTQTILTRR